MGWDGERSEKEKGEGKCGGRQFRFRVAAAARGEGESRLGGERSGELEKGGRGAKNNKKAPTDERRLTSPSLKIHEVKVQ